MDDLKAGMTVALVFYPDKPLVVDRVFYTSFYRVPGDMEWHTYPYPRQVCRVRNVVSGNWFDCDVNQLCPYQPAESPHYFVD
jgi:hypothetical protein